MNIKIKATKIELTSPIKDYIEEKMLMLEKYLGNIKIINCDVEVGLTTGGHKNGKIYRAEVNLNLPGKMLRVEKTEKDLAKAIDKVKDHLQRSIKRYKEKIVDKKRKMEEL